MAKALPAVLITGSSSGIGAVYADRFARRGHDLVLVARDKGRMETIAARLRKEAGVSVDVVQADLTDAADLAKIEKRLRDDDKIGVLINNAGAAGGGGFGTPNVEALDALLRLNVTAVTRLAASVAPRFAAKGEGAIVNIASVVALIPQFSPGIYSATKSFVLTLSQSLQAELGPKGVYVQVVLPSATRTEIWARAGRTEEEIKNIKGMMDVEELVDAALVGFDRRETITIPSLADDNQWGTFTAAREAMIPNFMQEHAAARYRA